MKNEMVETVFERSTSMCRRVTNDVECNSILHIAIDFLNICFGLVIRLYCASPSFSRLR